MTCVKIAMTGACGNSESWRNCVICGIAFTADQQLEQDADSGFGVLGMIYQLKWPVSSFLGQCTCLFEQHE